MRRVQLSVAAVLAASLMLAGCGGGDDKESKGDGPKGQSTSKGSQLSASWPLTGKTASGDENAAQKHPVVVAKIDNTPSSSPQVGLSKADLVVEELVEGGSTRLAVFFYSKLPNQVGPVRSMRASDIGIVKPAGATVVTSGAAGVTIGRINAAGVKFFEEGAKGIFRDNARSAPYNLFANLKDVSANIKQKDEKRPDDYLVWGDDKAFPAGQPAGNVSASFSGGHTTNWKFAGGKYTNQNSFAAKGDEFKADNVLVLRVKVGDAGYTDPAGNPVPETIFKGKGQATLFHKGKAVRGTWQKKGLEGALTLSTKAGALKVPAGNTWIELVPIGAGGNLTFGK